MVGSGFPPKFMGDSTTAELVVDGVDEKDRSGDENGKKADADKKLVKEKTKLTEKKGLKRSGEELGGGRPQKMQKMHSAPRIIGPIGTSIAN